MFGRRVEIPFGHEGNDRRDQRVAEPTGNGVGRPRSTTLCLPATRYGPFISTPPVATITVDFPAFRASRTSIQVMSSINTVSAAAIGRGPLGSGCMGSGIAGGAGAVAIRARRTNPREVR